MEYNKTAHQLLTNFKKVYDSVEWRSYNLIIEFVIRMVLLRLKTMCPNETYNRHQEGIQVTGRL